MVKSPRANAGDARDMDLIPRLGRSPGEGNGNPFQYPPGKIPWTEEPGGLYSYYLHLYCALAYSEYLIIIFSFKKEKHRFYLFIYFLGFVDYGFRTMTHGLLLAPSQPWEP